MSDKAQQRVFEIQLSNYIRPEIKEVQGKKWVLNGNNNEFYKTIIDAYNGSTTNSAIIDSYSQFIYGKGLTSNEKATKAKEWSALTTIFDKKELRRICKDFEMFGEASVEVKYLNKDLCPGFWNSMTRATTSRKMMTQRAKFRKFGFICDPCAIPAWIRTKPCWPLSAI